MFSVPMDMPPGVSVAGAHLLGERTNITWRYDGVRVPDRCRVGDIDAGWSVNARRPRLRADRRQLGEPTTSSKPPSPSRHARRPAFVASCSALRRLRRGAGCSCSGRRGWRPRVARRGRWRSCSPPSGFTAMAAERIAGPGGHAGGRPRHRLSATEVTTIYGGSSEVQRGIIVEAGWGFPAKAPCGRASRRRAVSKTASRNSALLMLLPARGSLLSSNPNLFSPLLKPIPDCGAGFRWILRHIHHPTLAPPVAVVSPPPSHIWQQDYARDRCPDRAAFLLHLPLRARE